MTLRDALAASILSSGCSPTDVARPRVGVGLNNGPARVKVV